MTPSNVCAQCAADAHDACDGTAFADESDAVVTCGCAAGEHEVALVGAIPSPTGRLDESARLSETERETLDAILVALWQCETEAGYAFGRTKIEKAVECILTDRLDRRLGENRHAAYRQSSSAAASDGGV